jgi:hypothetical protein
MHGQHLLDAGPFQQHGCHCGRLQIQPTARVFQVVGRLLQVATRHIVLASAPGDAPGADREVLVARYGGTTVTDADRDAAAAQLREHYAAGRLSRDEFLDQLDAVYRAQTARELGMVIDSLPHEGVVIPLGAPWDSYLGGYPLNVAKMRAAVARTARRIMLAFGVVAAGSLVVLTLLITAFMVHGGLLGAVVGALLAILAVGVVAVSALVWLAGRLWRRHAWIEAVPLAAGQPWLSGVARLARLLFTGHALWRLRTRLASRA